MPADTTKQREHYLRQHLASAKAVLDAIQDARAPRLIYDLRGYQTSGVILDADLVAAEAPHLTAVDYHAALAAVETAYATPEVKNMMAALAKLEP